MALFDKVVTVQRLDRFLTKLKDLITPAWIGLGNVDNTSDASKYVAYASTAGSTEKVRYNIIIRLKGGRTEGTNQFTYDGSISKSINITAAKIGAVAESQGTSNAGKILYVNDAGEVDLIDIATLQQMINGQA